MTKKRQKLTPWKKMKKALDKAIQRAEELDDELCNCQAELRSMTARKDAMVDQADLLRYKNLKLLEDYHELASDVLREQKSRNTYSEVGRIKDGVKND